MRIYAHASRPHCKRKTKPNWFRIEPIHFCTRSQSELKMDWKGMLKHFVVACLHCLYGIIITVRVEMLTRNQWDVCIIIDQLNRNFGRGGSALNRVCCCNMFQCCCFPDCSSTSNRERHLSLFAFPMKNKRLLKRWVRVIRRANPPLNRHTRTCSKHFVNAEGRRLYSDEVPLLTLPSNNRSLGNNWRKPPRYQFASLGDEPVTIVVTILFARGAIERLSTCASPEVPAWPFAGWQLPLFS